MSAGSITWNLGMMGFPSRVAARAEVIAPGRQQGQFRAPGADERKPAERWQRKESVERVLEKPLEAEWQVLVERCLKGDSFAWTELVKAHHRRGDWLCFRVSGLFAEAAELTPGG